jgi:glycosyltransferase involved in cell wall biosynthesis
MKKTALFISNSIYLSLSTNEGGVKLCTREYLSLIQLLYDVVLFPVNTHIDLKYRIKVKIGLNVYNDFCPEGYRQQLTTVIQDNNVGIVFLNMSNTASFAEVIKDIFGDKVKIVLCSHGNESGDYLHESTRFAKRLPFYKSILSSYTLGLMLKKEATFRQKFLDAVLTVSPVEESLEKWLGAGNVMMVPRTITNEPVNWEPVTGRVGFIGDLSHWPNFFGIEQLSESIKNDPGKEIEVRLVGSPGHIGLGLEKTYPFIKYLGYLNNDELEKEVSTWAFFLNPVYYYSRGVSTKLAKALGWGIPVITTSIGCRGYQWDRGDLVFAETPHETAEKIKEFATDPEKIKTAVNAVKELVLSSPTLESIGKNLEEFLKNIY